MSVADLGKVYVFSAISGTILKDGKPMSGVKLTRTAGWSSEQSDTTVTDEKGYFSLPAMTERSVMKFLPQEFVANQEIVARYDDSDIVIWSGVKRKPEENVESKGKALVVKCDLENDETMIKVNRAPIFSRCIWDVEPDEKEDIF